MGEKDISEKMLEAHSDVFADIINVLLFNGKQTVMPEDLVEMNTWAGYRAEKGLHDMERDVAKYWMNNGIRIASIGYENMTSPDSRMVFRIYGYDGAEYRNQCSKENRKKPAYPVITIILFFGTKKRWKDLAPTSLYETVSVPDELKQYVPNIKINVFDVAWLTEKQLNMFKSDFKIVADFFVQIRKNGKYNGNPDEMEHKLEILELLSAMRQDERFLQTYYEDEKGEIKNMDDVLDRIEKKLQIKKKKN